MSRLEAVRQRAVTPRTLALVASLGLAGAFTSVLYTFADVAGGVSIFLIMVGVTLVAATGAARILPVRYAVGIALVGLAVGMAWYINSLSYTPAVGGILRSNVELLTGESIHGIRRSGVWATAVVPAPLFATWYFALRKHYVLSTVAGASMLGYVVLTGDATVPVALLGVVTGIGLLAFGDLDYHGGSVASVEHVAIGLAVMVMVPLLISVIPASAANPISFGGGGGGGGQSLETTILDDSSSFRIQGSITLSPDVRFTIESEVGTLWKSRAYDRYTGTGWARTGGSTPLNETSLEFPPGARQLVTQRVAVESLLTTLPSAWRPVSVGEGIAQNVSVSSLGDLSIDRNLDSGDAYTITSAVRTGGAEVLRTADTDYPTALEERYTELPASTPDRVAERTAQITANADSAYETAVTIETWLEANREYSLDVDRPEGNIADAFLFDMEQGYCVYYATTMVVMLRTQGIPARFVSGYTTGQEVEDGRYVVRGLNAHAWVEVYFPDSGWVAFDPTPAGPRTAAENDRIEEARAANNPNVDTDESAANLDTPTSTVTSNESDGPLTPAQQTPVQLNQTEFTPIAPTNPVGDTGGLGGAIPELPPREHLA
ncbi:MAG: transglutaminase domain-containing protein, partial [Salinirussus sp.]